MAHNANTEDYQRLALRYVMAVDADPSEGLAGFERFWNDFSNDRDALPQTDADRAFHLVAMATETLDYRLPFAADTQVDGLLTRARKLLDEALALDPNCHDARRMRFCMDSPSFDERYAFLVEHKDEVRRACMDAMQASLADGGDDERTELACHLDVYPYRRWLAALADHALVCGHNHACLDHCHELLGLDPTDLSDVRFTMALCYAKTEQPEGLDHIRSLVDPGSGPLLFDDAWTLISRMALAYKENRLDEALRVFNETCALYPRAKKAFERQTELPDGLFARIRVAPYSEDELILALSEAAVLTQEGAEEYHMGPFGQWLIDAIVHGSAPGIESLADRFRKRGGA